MGKFTRAALEAMTIKQLKETASNESIDGIKSKMTKSDNGFGGAGGLLSGASSYSKGETKCFSDKDSWVVTALLEEPTDIKTYYCVDSTGVSSAITIEQNNLIINADTPCSSESNLFSEIDARVIAEKSCIKGGEVLASGTYNENSKTWWFDANLNGTKEGCNPACVVSEETKTAEINWRCTGLKEKVVCTMDAKQCPDGSYVGRSGPDCEFVCPQ